jgi:hypothetical protein
LYSVKFVTYNEAGDHYYLREDGSMFQLSRPVMRDAEVRRVWPETGMPGYEPIWDYHWHLNLRRLKEERFIESLTDEQRESILRGQYGDS